MASAERWSKQYHRCFTEGHYLAWLLGQIDPERPVVFIGYSFVALITLEALRILLQQKIQVACQSVATPTRDTRSFL